MQWHGDKPGAILISQILLFLIYRYIRTHNKRLFYFISKELEIRMSTKSDFLLLKMLSGQVILLSFKHKGWRLCIFLDVCDNFIAILPN